MGSSFLVGVTPDFFVDAKGRFEAELERVLGDAGIRWEAIPEHGKIARPDIIDQYDGIFALALRFDAQSVAGLKRLSIISRWGVGYDMIDAAALTANDIALTITPNAVKRPVAEAILTLLFALSSNLLMQDRLVREGKWRGDLPKLGRNLKGRTLGSVGCGNIAREMFRLVQSFGFGRLIACDPFVKQEDVAPLGVELVSMDEVFRESDYVTVNTFLNASTKGLVGEPQLRLMKPDAYFINTARGPIVDEAALVKALNEGWFAGAGLDVFDVEPLPVDAPIRNCPNTIFAPHGLAWTGETARDNSREASENLVRIAAGVVPDTVVNKDVIARAGFQAKLARYRS